MTAMFAQDRYEAMWRPVARQPHRAALHGAAQRDASVLGVGGEKMLLRWPSIFYCWSWAGSWEKQAAERGWGRWFWHDALSPLHPSFFFLPTSSFSDSLLLPASKHQLQKTDECLCSVFSHSHLGVCLLPDRPRLAACQCPATAGHYLPPSPPPPSTQWQHLAHLSHPRSHLSWTFASIAHTPVPLLLSDACKFGCFGICFRWDEGWWCCWIRI